MSTEQQTTPGQPQGGFFSYLKSKELDFFPTGTLRWWLLGLILLAWSVEQFERLKIGPVLVYVFEDFNVGLKDWGNVAAIAAIFQAVGAYTLSNLADKYGRRALMIWPVIVYLGIAIGSAMAPSFAMLGVLYMAGGFVVSGMGPAVNAASRDITPRMGRGMVYGWVSLAITLGSLMSTWAAAITLPIWPGWRPQFWLGAAIALVVVVIMIIFYRDLSPKIRGQIVSNQMEAMQAAVKSAGFADLKEAQKSGNRVYKDLRLWIVAAAMLFWGIAYVSVAGYVPTYLKLFYGVTPAEASALTSYFWLVFTISVMFSGWLSDKLRVRKTVTFFGGVSTGLCFIIASRLPEGTSYATLAIAWSITGFFSGFIYPAWCALLSENAEQISPFGVARAFGASGVLSVISGLFLNLGLPRVVAAVGWPTWFVIAGFACFCIALCTCAGRGPWWAPKDTGTSKAA